MTGSLGAFDLYRTDMLTSDPAHPGYSVASGEVRSRGIELDVAGQVAENISLIGSYAYDNVIIIKDTTTGTAAQLGKRGPGVPRHAGNMTPRLDRRRAGASAPAFMRVASVWGNNTNSWQVSGYVRFDTMLGYRTVVEGAPVETLLNVTNIGDAKYYETGFGACSYYGAPRTFIGSVKVRF